MRIDCPVIVYPIIIWWIVGCLVHFLATTNIAILDIYKQQLSMRNFTWTYVFSSLEHVPRSWIVGSLCKQLLNSFAMAAPFSVSTSSGRLSVFLYSTNTCPRLSFWLCFGREAVFALPWQLMLLNIFFMDLVAVCIPHLKKYLSKSISHFLKIGFVTYCCVANRIFVF